MKTKKYLIEVVSQGNGNIVKVVKTDDLHAGLEKVADMKGVYENDNDYIMFVTVNGGERIKYTVEGFLFHQTYGEGRMTADQLLLWSDKRKKERKPYALGSQDDSFCCMAGVVQHEGSVHTVKSALAKGGEITATFTEGESVIHFEGSEDVRWHDMWMLRYRLNSLETITNNLRIEIKNWAPDSRKEFDLYFYSETVVLGEFEEEE